MTKKSLGFSTTFLKSFYTRHSSDEVESPTQLNCPERLATKLHEEKKTMLKDWLTMKMLKCHAL